MKGHGNGAPSVVLLGLEGFVVLAAAELAGEVELLVETTETVTGCPWWPSRTAPSCDGAGLAARRAGDGAGVVEAAVALRRVGLPAAHVIGGERGDSPRSVLTERARAWAMRRVGAHSETVASVARQLAVGWQR